MAKPSKKFRKQRAKTSDFVVVAFAEDIEQAKDYEALLKNNDIPVIIRQQREYSMCDENIAVMVPEDCIDEAHVVIESQGNYDDFYNIASDEDNDNLDNDIIDNDF